MALDMPCLSRGHGQPPRTTPTFECTLTHLPSELLYLITSKLGPVDLVCLALTSHEIKDGVEFATKTPLNELCPRTENFKVFFRHNHKHCLNKPHTSSLDVSLEYEELMGRLRIWVGIRYLYCYACHRYRPQRSCRCEICDLAQQDALYWRRFFHRNATCSW